MSLWEGPAPELISGHLGDAASLAGLVRGAELVVHAAGAVRAKNRAGFFAANAEGAHNMAQAAASHARDARMVLVSSLAAREPQISDYAASKRAGEAAAREVLNDDRLTVVRPPALYGPGDRATLDVFRLALLSPVLPILGRPDARLAMVHVEDAAAEILRLARDPSPPSLSSIGGARPEGYCWPEMRDALARATGRPLRLLSLPAPVLLAAAHAANLSAALSGSAPVFSPGKAREMLHADWSVSPAELAPGAHPARFGLEEGFADTLRWYRAHGWL
jgi:nucleoside-diphosphate-sugar epimerase